MPMTFLLFLFFTGLCLIWFSKKNWKKAGKIILTITGLFFFLISFSPITNFFMGNLERTYPSITSINNDINYIWILGSSATYDTSIPLQSRLYQDGLYRVLEGVRLYNEMPEARVIFSGYAGDDIRSIADVGAEVAVSLGIPKDKIITISTPMDTWDEAAAAKKLIGNTPFILVTSAYHMKRSVFIFKQNGLNPTPAPCGHFIKKRAGAYLYKYLPSAHSIVLMHRYIHEQLGLLWLKIIIFFDLTDIA